MNYKLQSDIFCHDLINPPTHDRSCNIDLQLTKSEGLIDIERKGTTSSETIYSIRISNLQEIGFTNTEQTTIQNEYRNLILACNLVIPRVCITNKKNEYSILDLMRGHNESRSSSVKKIDNTFYVNIVDNVKVYDSIHITVSFVEKIDEKHIVDVFRKLQKINRHGISKSSTLFDMNLDSSLVHYETAMSEFDRLFKFKNIYNALELVTNIDGNDRKGTDFDMEVKRLDATNCMDIVKWRNFYNRTKHVQRNSSDIKVYEEGEKDLAQELLSSRKCAQKLLLSKLN